MLNYVWFGLILLGIGVALVSDFNDNFENKYKNGESLAVEIMLENEFDSLKSGSYNGSMMIKQSAFNRFYNAEYKQDVEQNIKLTFNRENNKQAIFFKIAPGSPAIWKDMAEVSGDADDITGHFTLKEIVGKKIIKADIVLESISFSNMKKVTNSALETAGVGVNIALGLIGIMALWLGIMKIAEEAGLIKILANAVKPITRLLFPDVPSDHPAMGSIIMNISANMLGLGNAATPFGLKAMEELDKLNTKKGTATNAMITFLVVNTAGLTLIPASAIAIRASLGSSDPALIIGTSFFGAACATVVGITSCKLLEKFSGGKGELTKWVKSNVRNFLLVIGALIVLTVLIVSGVLSSVFSFLTPELFKSIIQVVSILAIPMIILIFVGYGFIKKVKVYEVFVEGAKEGFNVAVKIIPYLVAMLVGIAIFRAGGALEYLIMLLRPVTDFIGMPAEALPMAIMRPLSGSGSMGIMAEIMSNHGPDSFLGILVSTFFGSTETTFYVLAVYFGSVSIRNTRHALVAGLMADTAGILGALFIVKLLFG